MFNTESLQAKADEYTGKCYRTHQKPTYKGLASMLNVAPQTIANVYKGTYNHKPYGIIPHHTRCIDNKDFDIIREVFSKK